MLHVIAEHRDAPHTDVQAPFFALPHAKTLVLGMPHLNASGLCANWLLRECAHLHWHAIARSGPGHPTGLRDRSGARCLASIVSAVIAGPLDAFHEDASARIVQDEAPAAANGWRSASRVTSGGTEVSVEIVSAFARRGGPSNTQLERADMPDHMCSARGVGLRARSRMLRSRSRSFRIASQDGPAPLVSAPVGACDLNGVGLLYFANFLRFFAMAEDVALQGPWTLPGVTRREVHWFGNADAGETLEVTAEPAVMRTDPASSINCFSSVRRRSDNALIAACETIWG